MTIVVKNKGRIGAALLAGDVSSASWATAEGHIDFEPTLVNRYVSLYARGDRLELQFALWFGLLPGADERKRLDTDGDGALSETERAAAQRDWQARMDALLAVTVDGTPWSLTSSDVAVTPQNSGEVVVELVAGRPLSPGEHRVRIETKQDPPRAGETEIAVEPLPGSWELVTSQRATEAPGSQSRFTLTGPRVAAIEDRSVTFVLRPASSSRQSPGPRPTRVLIIAAAALIASAAGVLLLRRRGGQLSENR